MGSIQKFIRERKAHSLGNAARDLKYSGKFGDAAGVYLQQAELAMQDNELIGSDDYQDAFEMWIRADSIRDAMSAAHNALEAYGRGSWLKGENSYIDNLLKMVNTLHKTDHTDEADQFLADINKTLTTLGEVPVSVTVVGKQHKFPAQCPHCSGAISYHGLKEAITCPFCQGVIDALD